MAQRRADNSQGVVRMARLDTSEFDDSAYAIVSSALALAERHGAPDRDALRGEIDTIAANDRKLHRAMVLFALARMCAHFARPRARQGGPALVDFPRPSRAARLTARLEDDLTWPDD